MLKIYHRSDMCTRPVDKEKENLKKKYLAEQRLHFEAEEELKQYKVHSSLVLRLSFDIWRSGASKHASNDHSRSAK